MAVFERLIHRRTVLTAPAIEKGGVESLSAEVTAVETTTVDLDDVAGYGDVDAEAVQDEAAPEHWEPECGTPVHSKRHMAR